MPRRISEIVNLPNAYGPEDIDEMRDSLRDLQGWQNQTAYFMASIRTNIETLSVLMRLRDAIDHFDKSSAELVSQTNALTSRGLWLNAVTLLIALASLAVALVALLR